MRGARRRAKAVHRGRRGYTEEHRGEGEWVWGGLTVIARGLRPAADGAGEALHGGGDGALAGFEGGEGAGVVGDDADEDAGAGPLLHEAVVQLAELALALGGGAALGEPEP